MTTEPRTETESTTAAGRPAAGAAGFTLLELLVVLLILGLLAGLVAPRLFNRVSDARRQTARSQIELLGTALDSYRLDNGRYPTTEQGLRALRERPATDPPPIHWRGPYLDKPVPDDPWGRPYVYRSPGKASPNGYDLLSLGADREPGGEGENADVQSWEYR